MKMESYYVIKRPLHTEKSVEDMRRSNQYHFAVNPQASKYDIKRAIEQLFPGVKVRSVNVQRVQGKERRMGWTRGRTSDWKKAITKLRPGDTIDIGF